MSIGGGPDPRSNAQIIEQERRKLGQRLDEVARLCETGMPASTFYGEMLQRLIESLAAVAGAIYMRTPQGHLQQQFGRCLLQFRPFQLQYRRLGIGLDKKRDIAPGFVFRSHGSRMASCAPRSTATRPRKCPLRVFKRVPAQSERTGRSKGGAARASGSRLICEG